MYKIKQKNSHAAFLHYAHINVMSTNKILCIQHNKTFYVTPVKFVFISWSVTMFWVSLTLICQQ